MSTNQTIKVFVRTKPTGSTENTSIVDKSLLNVDEVNSVISFSRDRKGHAEFQFSKVFGQSVSQQTVYNACSGVVVQDVIEGVNCCIMAYGQTGSGKTYTMYGKGWEDNNNNSISDAANIRTIRPATPSLDDSVVGIADTDTDSVKDLSLARPDSASGDKATKDDPVDISPRLTTGETKVSKLSTAPSSATLASATEDESMLGVIPRSIADLFRLMDEKTATSKNFDFTVYCQVMQIYNEKIYDLLQDRRRENPLQLRETGNGDSNAVCVRGMSVFRVYSKEEANQLLRKGLRNRAIRATDFNSESSRSHTILQLFVTTEEDDLQGTRIMKRSTFSLVDLAGSEKWRSSLSQSTDGLPLGASNAANNNTSNNADQQLKEMNNINTSLHVLGNCVSALIEVPARKHIPYRDSVLTRLLQDALGGNGRTILIATVHNDAVYREETYSTLQFASRASRIKVVLNNNTSVSNERSNLEAAQKQIKLLRAKVLELQQNNNNSNNISVGVNAEVNLASSLPRQKTITSSLSVSCSTCEANAKLILSLKKQLQEMREQNDYLVDTLDSHYIPYDLGSIVYSHKTPSAIGTPTAPQRKELNAGGNSGQCTPVKEPRDSQPFASIADVSNGVRRSHASSPMHLIPPSHNVPELMTSKNSTNQLNNVDINDNNGNNNVNNNGDASLDNESPFQFHLDVDLVAATGGREGASSLMSRSVTSLDSFGDDNNDDEGSVVSLSASKASSVAASVGNSQQRQRGKSSSTAVRKVKSKKGTEQKSGGGSSNKVASATTSSAAVTGSATKKRVVTADGLVVDSDSAEGITNNVDLLLNRLSFDSAALDIVASSVASRMNNINNSTTNSNGNSGTNMHYSVSAPNAVVQHTSGCGASASSTPLRSLKNAKAKKQSEEKQVSVHELHMQQQAQLHKLKELSGKSATAATVEPPLPQDRSVEAALAAVELALGNNSADYTSHAQSNKTNKSPVKQKSPVKDTAAPSAALNSGNSSHTGSKPQPYHSSSHVPMDYSSVSGVLNSSRDFGTVRGSSVALPTTTSTTTASNSALKPIISAVPPTSSNPAICVKHGLDSCVLCQMFAPKADPVVSSFGPVSSNPSASGAQGADVQQTGRPVDSYAYRPPAIYNHVTGAFEERVVTPVTAYNMQFPQPHHSAQVQQQSVQHVAQQPNSTYSSARAPPASSSQQPQQYQPQHYQPSPQFQSQPQQHFQPSPQFQTQLARPQLTSQPSNHPGFDSLVTEPDPSGDVCRTHGVTGCLLCAMRASRDSQTNNSTAASTFSPNTYHHFSPYAFKAAVAATNAPADLGPLVTGMSQTHSRAMSKPPTQPLSAESYDSSNMGYGFVDYSKKSRGISYSTSDHGGQVGRSGGNNADAAVTERHLSRTNSGNAFIRPAPSHHIQHNNNNQAAATSAGNGGFQPTNTKVSPRIHEIRSIPQLREQYQMPGTQHSPQMGSNVGQGAGIDIMSSGMYGNHHSNHSNLNNAVQSSAAAASANMNSSQATLHSHHSHGSSQGHASHRYASSAAAGDDDENSDEDNRSLHSQHSHHSHHSARKPRHIRELEHSSQVQLGSNPHYPAVSASSALQHPKVASSPLPSLSNIPLVQHPSRQQAQQQQASQYSHHQPVHLLPGGKSAAGSNIHYEEEEEQEEDSGEEQEERMNTAELIGHNNREMDSLLKEPTVSTKVKKMKKKVKKRKKTPATGPVGVGGNAHVPMTTKRRLEQKINHIGR